MVSIVVPRIENFIPFYFISFHFIYSYGEWRKSENYKMLAVLLIILPGKRD